MGKNLALLEMRMVICLFMQKLEIRFADGWDPSLWHDSLEDLFVTGMGQLPVVIQRRDKVFYSDGIHISSDFHNM